LELSLGNVNILIGANASGKSNFVRIFEFLRDIARDGLNKAISKDEYKYIKNINSDELSIEIIFDFGSDEEKQKYSIFIKFKENEAGIEKIKEEIILSYKILEPDSNKEFDSGTMIFSNNNGELDAKITSSIHNETPQETLDDFFKPYQNIIDIMKKKEEKFLLESPFSPVLFAKTYNPFSRIFTYDLDPQLSKKAIPIDWSRELVKNGENLVNVVLNILINPEKKKMFMNLVSYLLPYVEDIEVDKSTETDFDLKIKEKYSGKYLPMQSISDGTINALGLIVALYFEESPLIIIEEPDKGFHPSLISRVIGMMKDAAEYGNKQIIVTTHSPEMVKHADPKNVLLVYRDDNGFSHITRPYRKKDVKIFLENGMRLSDLYVDELLEI